MRVQIECAQEYRAAAGVELRGRAVGNRLYISSSAIEAAAAAAVMYQSWRATVACSGVLSIEGKYPAESFTARPDSERCLTSLILRSRSALPAARLCNQRPPEQDERRRRDRPLR